MKRSTLVLILVLWIAATMAIMFAWDGMSPVRKRSATVLSGGVYPSGKSESRTVVGLRLDNGMYIDRSLATVAELSAWKVGSKVTVLASDNEAGTTTKTFSVIGNTLVGLHILSYFLFVAVLRWFWKQDHP